MSRKPSSVPDLPLRPFYAAALPLPRIAILEDDPGMQALLRRILSRDYDVKSLRNRQQLLSAVDQGDVDLVLLDLGLPGDSGLDILRALRSRSSIPTIILSGMNSSQTVEAGLNLGADDYVTKPFHPPILQARIRSVLRRSVSTPVVREMPSHTRLIASGLFDPAGHLLVSRAGQSTALTERESHILSILAEKDPGNAHRDEISRRITGVEWDPSDRSLDVHVCRLRQKLLQASAGEITIDAVRGAGYRLRTLSDTPAATRPGMQAAHEGIRSP